jgi:hypothetical protein
MFKMYSWIPINANKLVSQYVLVSSHTNWPSVVTWLWLLALTLDWTILFLRDINKGDPAPQVRGVSDEWVIYGYGSCTTLTSTWLHCKIQPVLLSEREPYVKKESFKEIKIWSSVPKGIWRTNSMAWVRERTILTERLQLVGETKTNWPTDRRS